LIIERELSKSTKDLDNERNQKLAEFIDKNPDLSEIKDDIKAYAEKHQEMDIDDIATLIIAKSDPLKLLDEQTKNKLKGGY
jgi:HD-like signal output (HDOD) protein